MISLLALLLAVDGGSASTPSKAPQPLAAEPHLRDAKAVLGDYAKAIGDEKLWKKHRTLRVEGVLIDFAKQIEVESVTRIARGGKINIEEKVPRLGTFRRGSDGHTAWAEDPIHGLRVLNGAEAEALRISAVWNREWHLLDTYANVESIAPPKTAPADQSLECIELHKKQGSPTQLCFDSATHLRVWEQGVRASPKGPVHFVATYSGWRTVDGVKVPHHRAETRDIGTLESLVVEMVFDEPMPAKLFALPRKK